jgi:hypothetical protein
MIWRRASGGLTSTKREPSGTLRGAGRVLFIWCFAGVLAMVADRLNPDPLHFIEQDVIAGRRDRLF